MGIVQEFIGNLRQQAYTQQAMTQDAPWMYRTNADGSYLRDLFGNLVPTEDGSAFAQALLFAQESGVQDVERQRVMALRMIGRDPQQPGQPAKSGAAAAAQPARAQAAAAPAAAAPKKTKEQRNAENLSKLQRRHGMRGADASGGQRQGTNGNGTVASRTSKRQSPDHVIPEHPAWANLDEQDEFSSN
jgi:pyruvate/2-oxoglutarate dehydrogenase complex dihydrolipoamide acyltransferase (E2) component